MSVVVADKIVGRYIKWDGDTWQVLATGVHLTFDELALILLQTLNDPRNLGDRK